MASADDDLRPLNPAAIELEAPAGGLGAFPPAERWEDWAEYDPAAWPRKVEKHYTLVPTVCFNCEAGCGLLGYVDKRDFTIRKFEGNPRVSFQVGELPDLGIAERFDLVTAFEIVYYLTPEDIRRAFDAMDQLGKKRILSVYWPHLNVLDASLFSTRSVAQQTIYWESKPRWLVVWW